MAYWPRKRARRSYPRVNASLAKGKEVRPVEFAGYKAGMTHLVMVDNRQTSKTKGQPISIPVTIIECPPLNVVGVRFLTKTAWGTRVKTEVFAKPDKGKELGKRLPLPKKDTLSSLPSVSLDGICAVHLLVATQPNLVGFGKKIPDLFEVALPGAVQAQADYAKSVVGKELAVQDILKEGQQVDVHAVTKGKGFQGPVKRFGVAIRQHKAEKTKRGPGSLGAWRGQQHMMYRVAHAGQMGYHSRTEWNKPIVKISSDVSAINPAGGIGRYGLVKSPYLLLRGSVAGSKKRLVRLTQSMRPDHTIPTEAPTVQYISTSSQQ
ncbi:50S ribosomal protein L3 [Candidatus Woesearchaeota archaeon]|nr:50S ribosomal protein L3 [Candidatus Woesearchaeota archaeon]